ncbi:alpha/beta hydrolase [Nocardia veterana]|uniref:Alpha/beta fold hydrolase n=1 Tax=Nocardia veterana TaxID=132249 RepID=A0A7X6RHD7_9NOCA|nr:alpha/beta fold hydrolase [Nocardia veterana]NKY85971.1 alpha/beta fold hydrolase [Nocardia veterana]
MPYFPGARGRLHYRIWPVDGSADPAALVVFLPGSGQHSGHYHRFGRALGRRSIELWCLDTSGQGLSEGDPQAPGTLAELAADAAALVRCAEARHRAAPLLLAGHSLGAATALAAAGLPELSRCAGMVLTGTPRRALGAGSQPPPGMPVLALHGVDDRRAPIDAVREWAARHPSVGLHEYPDAGHDLLHEPVQAAVTGDIAEWIGEVATGRRGTADVG